MAGYQGNPSTPAASPPAAVDSAAICLPRLSGRTPPCETPILLRKSAKRKRQKNGAEAFGGSDERFQPSSPLAGAQMTPQKAGKDAENDL